jgi:rhamnulokinase
VDPRAFAAVDLGASSGRVVVGLVEADRVALRTVHRFRNGAREVEGHLRWPIDALFEGVLRGLAQAAREHPQLESIGIDTWGVDYALLDVNGDLLAEPISYRDDRTAKVTASVHEAVSPDELFAINGLQHLPFTTIYQLAAEQRGPLWSAAASIVLLPDLLAFWLTGVLRSEPTIASTTGLLDVHTGTWSSELAQRLAIPGGLLPEIEPTGTVRATLTAPMADRLGLSRHVDVTSVGSHDTASAGAWAPSTDEHFAYISSGTWSLVGVELASPVLSSAAHRENFANERGVDGTIRFLRNTGGLWLLQELIREWSKPGRPARLADLLGEAADLPANAALIDVGDQVFLAPGPMAARIAQAAVNADYAEPKTRGQLVRCVIDSLARAYAETSQLGADLAGVPLDVLHLIGGGSQGPLLCQATANWSGLPVVAGPAEATALGNVLVQARTHGALALSLAEARAAVARSTELGRYEPQ